MTTMQSGKTPRKTSPAKNSAAPNSAAETSAVKTPAVKTRMAGTAPESFEPVTEQAEQAASAIPQQDWRELVAKAAYYRAEARGFEPGSPEQDWFAAEDELKQRLGKQ
jgi:hypothetical protein